MQTGICKEFATQILPSGLEGFHACGSFEKARLAQLLAYTTILPVWEEGRKANVCHHHHTALDI